MHWGGSYPMVWSGVSMEEEPNEITMLPVRGEVGGY